MAEVIVRTDEGLDPLFPPPWDSIWQENIDANQAGYADWQLADPTIEANNIGGYSTQDRFGSAVLMCLFTDLRAPDEMLFSGALDNNNPRGWHGDTFDIDTTAGEGPLGSLLWTLERQALTDANILLAQQYARAALQTLITQKACADVGVNVTVDKANQRMNFNVRLYSDVGDVTYNGTFGA